MKRKFAILLILICSLLSFTACSSSSVPVFTLQEKLILWEFHTGESFSYSLDMKMNKKFRYRGSSASAGYAHVSLYTEIDGITYTLKSEGSKISADYVWVTLKKGQELKVEREFQAVVWDEDLEEYVPAPEGFYHAKFSFFEVERTLENVVLIVPEST